MTHEEIEAARLRLQRIAALAVNADEAKAAFDDIDALCEAARGAQPESLVGKRCRTIQQKAWWPPTEVDVIADQGNGTYLVEVRKGDGGLVEFRGSDLELIEPTSAKGGDLIETGEPKQ